MKTRSASATIAASLFHHAWPVFVAQVLSMGMMVADTVIAGRFDTTELAAVAIGSGLYIAFVMLLVGILQAVAPVVAHHIGAGRHGEIGPSLQQGCWLALILSVPGVLLLVFPDFLLELARVPEALADRTGRYLTVTAVGLPAMLLYRTFYAFTNAIGRPRILMAISLLGTAVHIPLAWALVNGHLGLPPLGGVGCGVSSAIVSWLDFGCSLAFLTLNRKCRAYRLFANWQPPRLKSLGELLRLGLPMGLSAFIEITAFTLIALLASPLGEEIVSGHRIVANVSALTYMLPLSMAIATLVLVGQAVGARDWARARQTIRVSLWMTCALACFAGGVVWLLREPVAAVSSADPAVREVVLQLIIFVCLYQLFDAIQTVAAHALRGYKITMLPMVLHVICFWGFGLAGGYWLCFHAPWRNGVPSVAGFWEGSVLATLVASILFGGLLLLVMRRYGTRG